MCPVRHADRGSASPDNVRNTRVAQMPVHYTIDGERGVIFAAFGSRLADEDVEELIRRLLADPDFLPSHDQLVDTSAVTDLRLSATSVIRLAETGNPGFTGRRAIVAPSPAVFGVSRMFEMYRDSGSHRLRVFREMAEAREWLGLAETAAGRPHPH